MAAKPKQNSLKIKMKAESGLTVALDVVQMHARHHLAIYKLITGTFTLEQVERIHGIIDEKKPVVIGQKEA